MQLSAARTLALRGEVDNEADDNTSSASSFVESAHNQ
jgi:hypothetical protein